MSAKKTKQSDKIKKGTKFVCGACGMVVSVADPCCCADVCDLYCCGQPMKIKKKAKK